MRLSDTFQDNVEEKITCYSVPGSDLTKQLKHGATGPKGQFQVFNPL